MCYSHFGNVVHNGAVSITQWGYIIYYYKVNKHHWPMGKIMITVMGFARWSITMVSAITVQPSPNQKQGPI